MGAVYAGREKLSRRHSFYGGPNDVHGPQASSHSSVLHLKPDDLLQLWWLVAAMLVFMMQLGFLLLETGLIQERHQAGIAVKSMMMLLASSTAYTLVGHAWVWGNARPPLDTAEWQFYQTGFAAVAATILSGALAGRTTLVSNVIMAAFVGGVLYPLHARFVWGDGFPGRGMLQVHDFAGSGSVHLLGGLVALAGAVAAGPRREKRDAAADPNPPIHINPRSLPLAACGVLFLWIGWMGFNGGSIQSADQMNTIGRLVISTCLAASAGGFAVSAVAGVIRLAGGQRYVYAPYATLSGIMAGMVANSASCDLIAASDVHRSLIVGAVAGIFAYGMNWIIQQMFHVDDPIEAIAVHAGGGFVGLIFAGLYRSPWSPWNVWPQLIDISVLVTMTVIPSWILFKIIDVFSRFPIGMRTPLRLKSTSDEENLGLTFDDPTTLVGRPPVHFHYLPDDVKMELSDYMSLLTSMPIHIGRSLHESAEALIGEIKRASRGTSVRTVDLLALERLHEDLQRRIESVPDVLRRLKSGKGEPVSLVPLVESIAESYRERYPAVRIAVDPGGDAVYVNGDSELTREAIRMVVSNGVNACMQRLERIGMTHTTDVYVTLTIDQDVPRRDGEVYLYVRDNGQGIDPQVRHYLGQPLTGFTSGRGYGLGLFFASYITQLFGGRLDCTRARNPNVSEEAETEFLMRFRVEVSG